MTRYRFQIERLEFGEFTDDDGPFGSEEELHEHALAVSEFHGGDVVTVQVEEVRE